MGRYREGRQVRKTSVGWQSPRAQEAAQQKARETDKPETETKKQPQREGRHQKGGRPAAGCLPWRPCPGSPPPRSEGGRRLPGQSYQDSSVGGGSHSRLGAGAGSAKRPARLPWPQRQREGLRRGWDRSPRGAPAAGGPWGSLGSPCWTGAQGC